jgi:hypothetical protein
LTADRPEAVDAGGDVVVKGGAGAAANCPNAGPSSIRVESSRWPKLFKLDFVLETAEPKNERFRKEGTSARGLGYTEQPGNTES